MVKTSKSIEETEKSQILNNQLELIENNDKIENSFIAKIKLKLNGFFFSILSSLTAVLTNVFIKKTTFLNGFLFLIYFLNTI
jgi:hypothetical protein